MSDDDVSIDIDEVGKGTDAAYRVVIDGETHFLPRSCCRVYEKQKKAFGLEWLFLKKGLI